ncbi:L-asparaginase, type II family protein, partial [Vibrio parahaemolyticus V-223/04]
TQKAAAC